MGLDAGSLERYLHRAQGVFAALWPARCTIDGQTVGCAETSEDVEMVYEDRGRVVQSRVCLRVDKAAFRGTPAAGMVVAMQDGRNLRVVSVSAGTHDIGWTLYCEAAGK